MKNNKNKKYYAIVGEGITEYYYFTDFNKNVRNLDFTICPDLPKHPDFNSIIKKAEELLNTNAYDIIFCVFDLDIIKNDTLKNVYNQLKLKYKSNKKIVFIESNPCFELWFLLHFLYSTRAYEISNDLIDDLLKYLPNYEKNNQKLFTKLNDKLKTAISNSKKLEECYEKNSDNIHFPFTKVYKIFNEIYQINQ